MANCDHNHSSHILDHLLDRNRDFATGFTAQRPPVLWIGCCDSRVPESVILQSPPGQIFTTRTIANIVKPTLWPKSIAGPPEPDDNVDPNSDSAIIFPVASLGVKHIIVAGHTRCGGVAACIPNGPRTDQADKERAFNPLKIDCSPTEAVEQRSYDQLPFSMRKWLEPIRKLVENMEKAADSEPITVKRVTEENVRQQVRTVASSTVVQQYWRGEGKGSLISVRGWMYDVDNGEVTDLGFIITKDTPREEYMQPEALAPSVD
ncbi:hypothetical protein PHLGIDRAFT_130501 [Phlebiopsis gigantea 11061_1 CR5-6]|uniref:Carbonic anhydrase n=1 Tax=Phlebiopsis gigantea (strain 11061_1 CR5-6) TaxID=745531 RepID=A0A0C3S139_PHLG1|nr:hypothetical protein PHLGIDRAFT_130501 [Phlebiopsis gigantea 11061_1 CR5-6]